MTATEKTQPAVHVADLGGDAVPDIEPILAASTETFAVNGIPCQVKRIKSREFLALMRVITKGLGGNVARFKFSMDDADEAQAQILALLLMAIPNAIDEFADLLMGMVQAKDRTQQGAVMAEMQNPDVDVLMDAITVLLEQEKDDMVALVGKARASLTKIQGLYQN